MTLEPPSITAVQLDFQVKGVASAILKEVSNDPKKCSKEAKM